MTNMDEFCEDKYLTVDVVSTSPTKACVITGPASFIKVQYPGKAEETIPEFPIQIDAKSKLWRTNLQTRKNLKAEWGSDDSGWQGKRINLRVEKAMNGKQTITGYPVPLPL